MNGTHVLLCYLGRAQSDETLRAVAGVCLEADARLSVVVPVVDAAMPSGCCGIQGEQWRRLLDEEDRDAAQRAVRLLESCGCAPQEVAIEVGASVPEIARAAAARRGCDVVAVSTRRWPWSTGGLSRRQIAQLRRAGEHDVLDLSSPSARDGRASPRGPSRARATSG